MQDFIDRGLITAGCMIGPIYGLKMAGQCVLRYFDYWLWGGGEIFPAEDVWTHQCRVRRAFTVSGSRANVALRFNGGRLSV